MHAFQNIPSRLSICLILLLIALPFSCSTSTPKVEEPPKKVATKKFFPAGEKEKILDEKGVEVEITDLDISDFQKPSTDVNEIFRVLISSDSYQIRQIRASGLIRRKQDEGGDKLMMEEVAKFDKLDRIDDGSIIVKLNSTTGKLENVNFRRIARIFDLAKIMQNDSTRWVLEHKKEENPDITKYLITYIIKLQNKSSTSDVKDMLKKEVKR